LAETQQNQEMRNEKIAIVGMYAFLIFIAIRVSVATFQKCGWKMFLLGSGAPWAAMMEMCVE
jgi:hypothetical protein